IYDEFLKLAGGAKARLVIIPTASETAEQKDADYYLESWKKRGAEAASVLHTPSREKANDPPFVSPGAEATGVWLGGGDQRKLVAAYRGTAVEAELHKLLGRGGVVGGTSAGAAVMSGPMITGGNVPARLSQGFGFLPGGVVDQHFLRRNRAHRLLRVLHQNPGWFRLGLCGGDGRHCH